MNNLRNPIVILCLAAILAIAGVLAWPHYARYQEQTARRECAEQIAQKKKQIKQARAEWEKKCDEAKNINKPTIPIAERFVEHSCEALYGEKPPEGSLTVDDERELIKLCMERKGY